MIVHLGGGARDQVWVVLSGLEELVLRESRSCWGQLFVMEHCYCKK